MRLFFVVLGPPVPCQRPVFSKGRAITRGKTRSYEETVAVYARVAMAAHRWKPEAEDTFGVELAVYRAARRGDWDNYAKAVCDGLTKAGVWKDDSAVLKASVGLYVDREHPRVTVEVVRL